MNNKYSINSQIERHLKLWIYFLPVAGIIPAIWTLYRDQGNREQQKASRISIILIIFWLSSYCCLSLGAAQSSDLLAFRLLYINALFTTGYFLTCTFLMFRLGKENKLSLPKINKYTQSDSR